MSGELGSIAVIGGGLGGFAAGVALQHAGFDVDLYERSPQLGEVGAGINVSQQAVKALHAIGLADRLAAVGNAIPGQVHPSMFTGEQLSYTEMARPDAPEGRFAAPYYVFHRADLLDAVAGAFDESHLWLDHQLTDLEEQGDRVALTFGNGLQRSYDLVIGADGIKSRVREVLYGADDPQFTGQVVWRALVDATKVPDDVIGDCVYSWVGRGSHIMTYYVRGKKLVNLTTQLDADSWVGEGWSTPGDPEELRRAFPEVAPPLRALLDAMDTPLKWGLFTRQPSPDWGHGRVQLIGDAAHAMLPNAGQGASQAFEDAYVLARWLRSLPDEPERALAGFRNVRLPRVHAIQRQSQLNAKLVHAGDWEQRQEAFRVRAAAGDTPLGMSWIYDYEPETEWSVRREYPLSFGFPAAEKAV